ncbi:integrase [Bifidobacterium adolescentis]|nr:integrase [Bifidobacterium adolescentis]AZH71888.1 integrase [Bifidobacterium adolescentis]
MNELRAQQKSFALQNMRSKGLNNAGLPFKATGRKGGISRQGSKRG